jgi:hypothetical protein
VAPSRHDDTIRDALETCTRLEFTGRSVFLDDDVDDDRCRGNGQCEMNSVAQDMSESFDVSWAFGTFFFFIYFITNYVAVT